MVIILSQPPVPPPAPAPPSLVITQGDTLIKPLSAPGYESTRPSRNIVHPILGRRVPDITLRPAGVRTGTLRLIFPDDIESAVAEEALAAGGEFVLTHTDSITVDMLFIVDGDIQRRQDDSGAWEITFRFQETTE